jgi:Ca2+-binding EF-hand superfamily protein
MDMEMKCPHCDQWVSSEGKSCSKCGGLLFESKEGANVHAYKILASLVKIIKGFVNSSISSLKKNWKLVTGLAVAVLILSVLFRKPDLSGQLGFYGQWDKDKDGYLDGTEIVAAMTELSKVDVNATDISGESRVVKFRWEPPRDIDLDQRLSREELTQRTRGYFLFQEYDLDKDGLLSKAEIEKEPVADIAGVRRKQLLFEPLKKFDLNQDGKLALLEIPPYHSYFGSGMRMSSGRGRSSGRIRTEQREMRFGKECRNEISRG